MNHQSGITEKINNFLYNMGAREFAGGETPEQKRKFRKIKRIAYKRVPLFKDRSEKYWMYRTIYEAFELHKYTRHGGYYWKDFRPLINGCGNIFDPDELSKCRIWSLHGPVFKEKPNGV